MDGLYHKKVGGGEEGHEHGFVNIDRDFRDENFLIL